MLALMAPSYGWQATFYVIADVLLLASFAFQAYTLRRVNLTTLGLAFFVAVVAWQTLALAT